MSQKSCLIIGAGISGLMAANKLKKNNVQVTVLDKSRGVGGRMATRRIEGSVFDHGSQVFSCQKPVFKDYVDKWLEKGIIREWDHDHKGKVPLLLGEKGPAYIGKNGMTALPKYLTQNISVKLNRQAITLNFINNQWQVKTSNEEKFVAESLILTAPIPQSLELLHSGNLSSLNGHFTPLTDIEYQTCLVVLVLLDGKSNIPQPGAIKLSGEPLVWICDNQMKGISKGPAALTIQTGSYFSQQYWNMDNETITRTILYMAADWIRSKYSFYQLKRWKYSQPKSFLKDDHLLLTIPKPLVFAGDAFGGTGVEGAAVSGLSAAEAVLNSLNV